MKNKNLLKYLRFFLRLSVVIFIIIILFNKWFPENSVILIDHRDEVLKKEKKIDSLTNQLDLIIKQNDTLKYKIDSSYKTSKVFNIVIDSDSISYYYHKMSRFSLYKQK